MTADKHRENAAQIANSKWVRYWFHYNFPQENPWLMALHAKEAEGTCAKLNETDMINLGYFKEVHDLEEYWLAERTNEDGGVYGGSRDE